MEMQYRNEVASEIERLESERDGLVVEDWSVNEILDRIDAIDSRIFRLKLQLNENKSKCMCELQKCQNNWRNCGAGRTGKEMASCS